MDIILAILTLGLKPLYDRHLEFYKILMDFKIKMPRIQNQARIVPEDELKNTLLQNIAQTMSVMDLSTQKSNITESDIDEFYNKLENFNLNFLLFKEYYRGQINNFKRFDPKASKQDFHTAIIVNLLEESDTNPLKPLSILTYHLKWKWNLTSKFYLKYLRKN
jgi:hypothetical protein